MGGKEGGWRGLGGWETGNREGLGGKEGDEELGKEREWDGERRGTPYSAVDHHSFVHIMYSNRKVQFHDDLFHCGRAGSINIIG